MSKTIINGIDVSECMYAADTIPVDCENNTCFCYEDENCYFKQLKRLQEENKELKEKNSQKSNLIWYIYHCSKIETIQRLLYEYYECINDDRYNKERVKKFWDDVFHLQPRRKYKSKYKQVLEEIKEKIKSANCPYYDNGDCSCMGETKEVYKYKQALEEIKNTTEKLITEIPEYNSCYYKDECGDNCTPKKQNKVGYCCFENVDKILTIINEVLNDRD